MMIEKIFAATIVCSGVLALASFGLAIGYTISRTRRAK